MAQAQLRLPDSEGPISHDEGDTCPVPSCVVFFILTPSLVNIGYQLMSHIGTFSNASTVATSPRESMMHEGIHFRLEASIIQKR
jgi:hypothetical protein